MNREPTEAQIQQAVEEELALRGFLVLHTSEHRRRQRCPSCGHELTSRNGSGTTPGVPDLLITHRDWYKGSWLGLEMKRERGTLSPAQRELARDGHIWVAYGHADAIRIVLQFHEHMKGGQL